jgi:hypothetical protein
LSDKKLFRGVRYEIECSSGDGSAVTFQAVEDAQGVIQLVIRISIDGDEAISVWVAPENLAEAFTATMLVFNTVTSEGLKRAKRDVSPWGNLFDGFAKAGGEGS